MKYKIFGLKKPQESTSYGLHIFLQDVSAPLHSKPHVAVHAFGIQWNLKLEHRNPLFITRDG